MTDCDAVVIGAGPVGLFTVFQLGLLGIQAHIVDVLPEAGGQCVALYPDKPIYDVPGIPVCTGRELARQLLQQAAPFMPASTPGAPADNLHLGHLVSGLTPLPGGGFELRTQQGLQWRCKVVVVAAGAGAFVPKTLSLPGLDAPNHVHHHTLEPAPWTGQHLVIAGGADEALHTAIEVAELADPSKRPARLTLLHRRAQFQAEPALLDQAQALMAQGRIHLVVGQPTQARCELGQLKALAILGPDGQAHELPLDHLMVRQGMSPKLGPIADWGLALERKQVIVSPASFESAVPGVYAVGDINTYPGKKRLLLCGFHEATLAAHHAAAALHPEAPPHLLYTTTSPLLHQRLGVA